MKLSSGLFWFVSVTALFYFTASVATMVLNSGSDSVVAPSLRHGFEVFDIALLIGGLSSLIRTMFTPKRSRAMRHYPIKNPKPRL